MRIALISDIHGNVIALDAVLADARSLGVDELWFIGDYCAIGPEPAAVLDRIAGLDGARFTRGNTDCYLVTGEGPPPDVETVRRNPALIPTYAAIAASFAWTTGYLSATGWLDWLTRLSLEFTVELGGVCMLAVHAAPGNDDGEGVHPGRTNAELRSLADESGVDLLLVGHTHEPMLRRVDGRAVVNAGAVSNPRLPDLRASYVVLEPTYAGVDVTLRRVAYDHAAFIDAVGRSGHPAAEFIISHQRGQRRGHAPHADHTQFAPGVVEFVGARSFSK